MGVPVSPGVVVEFLDLLHLVGGELEVVDLEVLLEVFGRFGFGECDEVVLDGPPQGDLRDGFVVFQGQGLEERVGQEGAQAVAKWRVRFNQDIILPTILNSISLPQIRMHFYLINHGFLPTFLNQML